MYSKTGGGYGNLYRFDESYRSGNPERQANSREKKGRGAAAEKIGIKVKEAYSTLGAHDGVAVVDAPNDEAITTWALSVGSLGYIHTQTMRAFSADEMSNILAKIP